MCASYQCSIIWSLAQLFYFFFINVVQLSLNFVVLCFYLFGYLFLKLTMSYQIMPKLFSYLIPFASRSRPINIIWSYIKRSIVIANYYSRCVHVFVWSAFHFQNIVCFTIYFKTNLHGSFHYKNYFLAIFQDIKKDIMFLNSNRFQMLQEWKHKLSILCVVPSVHRIFLFEIIIFICKKPVENGKKSSVHEIFGKDLLYFFWNLVIKVQVLRSCKYNVLIMFPSVSKMILDLFLKMQINCLVFIKMLQNIKELLKFLAIT